MVVSVLLMSPLEGAIERIVKVRGFTIIPSPASFGGVVVLVAFRGVVTPYFRVIKLSYSGFFIVK